MTQFTDLSVPAGRSRRQQLLCKMEMQAWSVAMQDQKDKIAQIHAQLIQVMGAQGASAQLHPPDFGIPIT